MAWIFCIPSTPNALFALRRYPVSLRINVVLRLNEFRFVNHSVPILIGRAEVPRSFDWQTRWEKVSLQY